MTTAYFLRARDVWRGPFWKPPTGDRGRVVSVEVSALVQETIYSRNEIGGAVRELLDSVPLEVIHEAARKVCGHAAAYNLPPDEVAHVAAKRMRVLEALM